MCVCSFVCVCVCVCASVSVFPEACVCVCVCITNIRIDKSGTFVCLLFVSKSFSSLLWTSQPENRFFFFGQCHGQYSSAHRI